MILKPKTLPSSYFINNVRRVKFLGLQFIQFKTTDYMVVFDWITNIIRYSKRKPFYCATCVYVYRA